MKTTGANHRGTTLHYTLCPKAVSLTLKYVCASSCTMRDSTQKLAGEVETSLFLSGSHRCRTLCRKGRLALYPVMACI